MAIGLFRLTSPGHTYSSRITKLPASSLTLDPSAAGAPVEGEWLALYLDKFQRPDAGTGAHPQVGGLKIAYPLLSGKGRSDVQSSGLLSCVLDLSSATVTTDVYAPTEDGPANITYLAGDNLVVARIKDPDVPTTIRSGLAKEGAVDTAGTGSITADGLSALVVAKVLRTPYTLDGKTVIDIQLVQ